MQNIQIDMLPLSSYATTSKASGASSKYKLRVVLIIFNDLIISTSTSPLRICKEKNMSNEMPTYSRRFCTLHTSPVLTSSASIITEPGGIHVLETETRAAREQ